MHMLIEEPDYLLLRVTVWLDKARNNIEVSQEHIVLVYSVRSPGNYCLISLWYKTTKGFFLVLVKFHRRSPYEAQALSLTAHDLVKLPNYYPTLWKGRQITYCFCSYRSPWFAFQIHRGFTSLVNGTAACIFMALYVSVVPLRICSLLLDFALIHLLCHYSDEMLQSHYCCILLL